jgi:hypothetical protein
VYASAKRVYDQLSDADQYRANALVANTQDLFAIAHDNHVNIFRLAPLIEIVFDTINVADVEKTPFRAAEQPRVIGYGFTLGWRVDDGKHLFEMIQDKLAKC